MLDTEISLGLLMVYVGLIIGGGLLIADALTAVPLAPTGIAVIVVTCTHALRRCVVSHDAALRSAFELGRDHERLQSVKSR